MLHIVSNIILLAGFLINIDINPDFTIILRMIKLFFENCTAASTKKLAVNERFDMANALISINWCVVYILVSYIIVITNAMDLTSWNTN